MRCVRRCAHELVGLASAMVAIGCSPESVPEQAVPALQSRPSGPPAMYDENSGPYVWSQRQKLMASDGVDQDVFGCAVSLDGATALVGAWGESQQTGAAYVFQYAGTGWTEQAKLVASDGGSNDQLGLSVSLSGDTALLGAPTYMLSGCAYVFVRTAVAWTEQAKLTPADSAGGDQFGWSVSVNGDTAVIGARGDDDAGAQSGAVYVFERSATSWAQQVKLVAGDAAAAHEFGVAVALRNDVLLAGATPSSGGASAGAAYVFERSATSWAEQAKLTASDAASGAMFGRAVSFDDTTAWIGAPEDEGGGGVTGAAYVFERSGTSWTEQVKLAAEEAMSNAMFGASLSVRGDTAVVGAPFDNGVAGAAYVYARLGSTWSLQSKLIADDGGLYEYLGISVSTSIDVALVGAMSATTPSGMTGAAYEFGRTLNLGEACSEDGECASGFCRDGVCCDMACDGPCEGCALAGSEGTCGPQPHGATGEPSCAPYLCDGVATACPTSCAHDDDCASGTICDELGQCVPPLAAGEPCSRDDQCGSGQCIDGVCGLDEGDPCGGADECVSGHCVDGVCCAVPDCSPYVCAEGGQCRQSCESTAHCAPGHTCNSAGQCVLGSGEVEPSEGCGCRLVGEHGRAPWLAWLAGLAFLGLTSRRRRGPQGEDCRRACSSTFSGRVERGTR